MYVAEIKYVIDTRDGVEYELSGPISGMYMIRGAGVTKLVTPSQLRRFYTYRDKPVAVYNSVTDGKGEGFLIRKRFFEELRNFDDSIEILYDSDCKSDYCRFAFGRYFLITTWSKPSFWIYTRPEDLSPVRKKYITRRVGTEGISRSLTAQFRITEINQDTLALMRGIIIDVVFANKDIVTLTDNC